MDVWVSELGRALDLNTVFGNIKQQTHWPFLCIYYYLQSGAPEEGTFKSRNALGIVDLSDQDTNEI